MPHGECMDERVRYGRKLDGSWKGGLRSKPRFWTKGRKTAMMNPSCVAKLSSLAKGRAATSSGWMTTTGHELLAPCMEADSKLGLCNDRGTVKASQPSALPGHSVHWVPSYCAEEGQNTDFEVFLSSRLIPIVWQFRTYRTTLVLFATHRNQS